MGELPPVFAGLGVSIPTSPKPTTPAPRHRPGATVKAFAVIDRPDGTIIWNTIRPAQADAWATYERHNPSVAGFANPAQLVEIELTVRPILPLFASRPTGD